VDEEKPLAFAGPSAAVFRQEFKGPPHLCCLGSRIFTKIGTITIGEPEVIQDMFNIFSAFLDILTEGQIRIQRDTGRTAGFFQKRSFRSAGSKGKQEKNKKPGYLRSEHVGAVERSF